MTPQHDTYPNQPAWNAGELTPATADYLREKLFGVVRLRAAFDDLGKGLPVGSSRTIYRLPVGVATPQDAVDAMLTAASNVSQAVYEEGLEDIGRRGSPYDLRIDEMPDQYSFPAEGVVGQPIRPRGNLSPNEAFGYLRVENTQAGLKSSVGALDPSTRTHYAVTLN